MIVYNMLYNQVQITHFIYKITQQQSGMQDSTRKKITIS